MKNVKKLAVLYISLMIVGMSWLWADASSATYVGEGTWIESGSSVQLPCYGGRVCADWIDSRFGSVGNCCIDPYFLGSGAWSACEDFETLFGDSLLFARPGD